MRIIDCTKNTDSHWKHNGRNVIVCEPVNEHIENIKELMKKAIDLNN